MKYTTFDPEAKVIGQAMLGFQAVINQKTIQPLLIQHGLTNIQPEQWYPLQKWLDVLNDIDQGSDKISNMLDFVDIGRKVAANIYMPEEMQQFVKEHGYVEFMNKFGASTYFRDHQGNVGQYIVEKINNQHVKFNLVTPYPPNFWYGIIYGLANRYCTSFVVQYEDISMHNAKYGELVIIHLVVNQ